MRKSKSYVYFAFKGDFNPDKITERIGVNPTAIWRKGEISNRFEREHKFSLWELSTEPGKEALDMDKLVKELIDQLKGKEDLICKIKSEFGANSILQIKMDIDMNEESSTPFVGHDNETIEFLYKTSTETDVDIYRYNSKEN
jgi:hypothetical protein